MRVAFVETVTAERYRHHRAEFFPFLVALVRRLGGASRWLAVGVPREATHADGQRLLDLPAPQRAALAEALAGWAPTAVVLHEQPSESLRAWLAGVVPEARLSIVGGGFQWHATVAQAQALLAAAPAGAGAPAPALAPAPDPAPRLLDAVAPIFAREWVGEVRHEDQPWRLAGVTSCTYRRPVRTNRFYGHLAAPLVQDHLGCAFCTMTTGAGGSLETPRVELALRQIEAHQRAAGSDASAYIIDDGALVARLPAFLDAIVERARRPTALHAMLRADTFLAQRERLERVLERMAPAGHSLRLLSMGAESFSQDENDRFNKGLTSDQLWACHDALSDLEARFPGTFACEERGHFATILFTPWTRPEDLRANIVAAGRLGEAWLNRAIGNRLQLRPETPIAELARHDGLITARHGTTGDILAVCLSSAEETELPWRFADPRTALLHRVLIRLDPVPTQVLFDQGDALLATVRRLRSRLPPRVAWDYRALALALVDAVEVLGPAAVLDDVFARVRAVAIRAPDDPATPSTIPRWEALWAVPRCAGQAPRG